MPASTSTKLSTRKTTGKYQPQLIEPKWPHTNLTSRRRLPASRSRGAVIRGKQKLSKYLPNQIESKWQNIWRDQKLYQFDPDADEKPYYTLVELPYPSGDLHPGHWFTFATADAHARYKRMAGFNVFYPPGFDAFGLPAENAAIKRGVHPKDWTMKNIEAMTKQFGTMGTSLDWSHQAITCLPEYYRWNQWIFIKMFEKGLAYRGKAFSNWCSSCQTVLANEAIENGKCWRCGTVVEQKEIEQWFLRITDYAERLLWPKPDKNGLSNGVDWPQSVRDGQNNWIGKSEGVLIVFKTESGDNHIEAFTTRPDTLFGATFLVLAPEHPLVPQITKPDMTSKVERYAADAKAKTELERKEMKEKTGVFTGSYAIHPLTKEKLPILVADYVLWGYGTGAIMAVPAHDERDYEFAQKYDLSIKQVIKSDDGKPGEAYEGPGILINSREFDSLSWQEGKIAITKRLEEIGAGKKKINYHLHDWSVSRQRYWGTPVPMIYCDPPAGGCGIVPVPLEDLPVELPYEVDYTPKGKPPLASAADWMKVKCPKCGQDARRDAETLDTFFDSAWYYYRYLDPKFDKGPFNPELVKQLMPLDVYFGGAEHTLGHTLYARFFTKFFHDIGLVKFEEFAKKRIQHGVILGPDGYRMSKSRGNVVNPDDVVNDYGADTVRLYLSFMMPYEATAPWNPAAISGVYRFLKRIWQLRDKVVEKPLSKEDQVWRSKTVKKVGKDLNTIKFNTAVATLMEWLNYLSAKEKVSTIEYKTMLLLLAPFAPHMAEELWHQMGEKESIHVSAWPSFDEEFLREDTVTIVVQVNGKVRDNLQVSVEEMSQDSVEKLARKGKKTAKYLQGAAVKKVIYVPGKLINFVI